MDTERDRLATPQGVHIACYVLMAALFTYVIGQRCHRTVAIPGSAAMHSGEAARLDTQIDPNTAGWAELARLPDVGESLAREIVGYRDERLARNSTTGTAPAAVFRCIEDLDSIPGVGEKTLPRIEPHLRFPD